MANRRQVFVWGWDGGGGEDDENKIVFEFCIVLLKRISTLTRI